MSAVVRHPRLTPHVRFVIDNRPPGLSWAPPVRPAPVDQPALLFDPDDRRSGPPRPRGHRVKVVAATSAEAPPPGLPDPEGWSASLALALAEALQGRRPVGQLSRWVDERVLATLTVALRRRRTDPPGRAPAAAPARLRSVHLQFPAPAAVEASAHVQLAERSSAFAFRLEAWYDRWLCTALELGPRDRQL